MSQSPSQSTCDILFSSVYIASSITTIFFKFSYEFGVYSERYVWSWFSIGVHLRLIYFLRLFVVYYCNWGASLLVFYLKRSREVYTAQLEKVILFSVFVLCSFVNSRVLNAHIFLWYAFVTLFALPVLLLKNTFLHSCVFLPFLWGFQNDISPIKATSSLKTKMSKTRTLYFMQSYISPGCLIQYCVYCLPVCAFTQK